MPTYDYQCRDCARRAQLRHSMNEACGPCPACGGRLERIFLVAPAFHGAMARGREAARRSLEAAAESSRAHGPGCKCCAGRRPAAAPTFACSS